MPPSTCRLSDWRVIGTARPTARRTISWFRSEAYDAAELRNYQDDRLRKIVQHAYDNTLHYRDAFDEIGLRPSEIRGVADLHKLPILERSAVEDAPGRFMTSEKPRRGWISGKTSGTSGSSLKVWYDREFASFNNAADRRQKRWAGMSEGDPIGVFLGRMIVPLSQTRPPFWQVNHIRGEVWFSAFHIRPGTLALYAREIETRRLRFLEGYPSTLFLLAQQLLDEGRSLPMQAVLTSSETLHETQRQALEQAFECEVFDFYGQAERVIFATECPEAHHKHLVQEYGITEVVDESGEPARNGETGYLVGTSLHNWAFPMLRYRMSDVASVSTDPCPCGRSSPRMAEVATRLRDFVVTHDGRVLPPSVLSSCFHGIPEIARSQIIQESHQPLRVLLVAGRGWDDGVKRKLLEALENVVGYGMEVVIEEVEEIPPLSNRQVPLGDLPRERSLTRSGRKAWCRRALGRRLPSDVLPTASTPSGSSDPGPILDHCRLHRGTPSTDRSPTDSLEVPSMRNKIVRGLATLAVLFSLTATPAFAKTSIEQVESEPAPAMVDIMLMRPLGLVMLGVSTALFVPAAGITAITRPDQMDIPYNALIRKPARFVFVDPIGSH